MERERKRETGRGSAGLARVPLVMTWFGCVVLQLVYGSYISVVGEKGTAGKGWVLQRVERPGGGVEKRLCLG